ncbi:MAG: threonine/serine exporter family protein [Clostridioides sp.]|jgi:uncharacterized membrane protein YjjB (DUF3815 family)|nr:threonine/serine exporter family protein [Clostridioides sp.]
MVDLPMWLNFLFGALATMGFAVFFQMQRKLLIPTGIVGGLGWVLYVCTFHASSISVLAGFVAGAFVSACSEILARKLKHPAIVFVLPGILPLIPGAGLYKTMLSVIQKNYSLAITQGTDALFLSASISLGILVINSIVRIFYRVKLRKKVMSGEQVEYNSEKSLGVYAVYSDVDEDYDEPDHNYIDDDCDAQDCNYNNNDDDESKK